MNRMKGKEMCWFTTGFPGRCLKSERILDFNKKNGAK